MDRHKPLPRDDPAKPRRQSKLDAYACIATNGETDGLHSAS